MSPADLKKWKERGGQSAKVLGIHGPLSADAAPMNPRSLEFRAKAKSKQCCGGCMFEFERTNVCGAAIEQAGLRGLPSCEDGFIYQAVTRDDRQIDLLQQQEDAK
jgi:hypothetical protein